MRTGALLPSAAIISFSHCWAGIASRYRYALESPFLFMLRLVIHLLPSSMQPAPSPISTSWLLFRIRVSIECRQLSLSLGVSLCHPQSLHSCREHVPGPLTFRMMLRDVSSMNSTRTCVTPPREPISRRVVSASNTRHMATFGGGSRTGSAQDSCDLHQFDGNLASIHIGEACSEFGIGNGIQRGIF